MKKFGLSVFLVLVAIASAQAQERCSPGVDCSPQRRANPIDPPPIDGKPKCAAGTREIACKEDGTGYLYSFSVTNNTGEVVTSVLVTPPVNSNYTITPQNPPLPGGSLANGQSVILTVTITGGQAGKPICFSVTLMTEKKACCTIELCVDLPNCCAIVKESKIECNKNGTYTYTFTITNKTPYTIQHIYLYPPPGVTITPSYFAVSLLPGATSQPLVITISASAGEFCFDISLHSKGMKTCCTFTQCIELPKCGNQTACAPGVCCSRAPRYDGTAFVGQKIAAVTGWRNDPNVPQNNVLTVFDLSGANTMLPAVNNAPSQYNGPASSPWTFANLGSIFGVTIDHLGNIYVTASAVYTVHPSLTQSLPPSDAYPGGPGKIFKISAGSGTIDPSFAPVPLPNTPDPAIAAPNNYPALGNISFDCPHKQFFVTNMDDGRIYRLDYGGNPLSTYDHGAIVVAIGGLPELLDPPGFASLGERLWGVQVHNNRIYYSVWGEDCANRNTSFKNQIWSIGLTALGDFNVTDRRLELTIPDLPGTTFSNPTSDISFAWDGRMLLSERTMGCSSSGVACPQPAYAGTTSSAHASRVLEFTCSRSAWTLSPKITGLPYKYTIGEAVLAPWLCPTPSATQPANSAGGNDYDYDASATNRVLVTGDFLKSAPRIYGLQGFSLSGGDASGSPLIGLYGIGTFKSQIGDVEVSCPPGENPY